MHGQKFQVRLLVAALAFQDKQHICPRYADPHKDIDSGIDRAPAGLICNVVSPLLITTEVAYSVRN